MNVPNSPWQVVRRRWPVILILIWAAVWTVLVVLLNDAYGLTVSDDPGDGGANMAARLGYFVLGAIWLAGVTLMAATVWVWRRR